MAYRKAGSGPASIFPTCKDHAMSDWTSGYVADIGYTFGYYTELNPLRARLALLNAGLACPDSGAACELGFGQGLSANVHAAGSLTEWHGTDFNPSQASFAQTLAAASGARAHLHDDAFSAFFQRPELPQFDYIGLHGIWSWVNDENRDAIVDFVGRKLKPGGVLYISYNTMPGWANFVPVRHLMTEHAKRLSAPGAGTVAQIDAALAFTAKLFATEPNYLAANPKLAAELTQMQGQDRHYLAHEYFNLDWQPTHFASIASALAPAKLQFACSATYFELIDTLHLRPEQQALLKEIPDPVFRESSRDVMVNQKFRRDYWVKGARQLSPMEREEGLRRQRLVLQTARDDVKTKIRGALGEAELTPALYGPVLDLMADHRPRTVAEIETAVAGTGIAFPLLIEVLLVLVGASYLAAVQDEASAAGARAQCERLNARLMEHARSSAEIAYLASPLTGGGVAIGRFDQLFLNAWREGRDNPGAMAEAVWAILLPQNQRLISKGETLMDAADNLAELRRMAENFLSKGLPILKALQLA
jgi:SAM-dependent methyltransferase